MPCLSAAVVCVGTDGQQEPGLVSELLVVDCGSRLIGEWSLLPVLFVSVVLRTAFVKSYTIRRWSRLWSVEMRASVVFDKVIFLCHGLGSTSRYLC